MENKEPKVFKTLVHKETGDYKNVFGQNNPELHNVKMSKRSIEHWACEQLDDYELKEVVVIDRSEYERLKGIEENIIKLYNDLAAKKLPEHNDMQKGYNLAIDIIHSKICFLLDKGVKFNNANDLIKYIENE